MLLWSARLIPNRYRLAQSNKRARAHNQLTLRLLQVSRKIFMFQILRMVHVARQNGYIFLGLGVWGSGTTLPNSKISR
jgi:hypothetical protein